MHDRGNDYYIVAIINEFTAKEPTRVRRLRTASTTTKVHRRLQIVLKLETESEGCSLAMFPSDGSSEKKDKLRRALIRTTIAIAKPAVQVIRYHTCSLDDPHPVGPVADLPPALHAVIAAMLRRSAGSRGADPTLAGRPYFLASLGDAQVDAVVEADAIEAFAG